jgi:hypothetical protein
LSNLRFKISFLEQILRMRYFFRFQAKRMRQLIWGIGSGLRDRQGFYSLSSEYAISMAG